jgi:hypothetical protein
MGSALGRAAAVRLDALFGGLVAQVAVAAGLRRVRLLSVAFITGQVCDTLTTHVALASGRFAEANPFFAPALESHHQLLAMGLKLGLSLAVLVAATTRLADPRRQIVLLVLASISLEAPAANGLRILGVL